jgi:hypothetical protein
MTALTAAQRAQLPDRDFALPGRRFPIPDLEHAQAALRDMKIEGAATPAEQDTIRAKIAHRYPQIDQSE